MPPGVNESVYFPYTRIEDRVQGDRDRPGRTAVYSRRPGTSLWKTRRSAQAPFIFNGPARSH
ncbi:MULTISPECIES: hypothetical protein [unclassified Microcoleus]|uniref:hypothetical protein n=1 Tax=unclassified Microcoleus TaxID=2642155 RepID=UPI00403F3C67